MKKGRSTDAEWLQWVEYQKAFTKDWMQQDYRGALNKLDRFLVSDPPADLQREALTYRAWIHRDLKDLKSAKADLLAAFALAREEPGYIGFELLDSLGFICKQGGEMEEAESWYVRALQAAASDPRIAAGGLLLRLIELRGERGFSERERRLMGKVIRQTWHLLRIEGEPDLSNLVATARKLLEAEKGPFSDDSPPMPREF